jgi:pimeloyl-ACP methyl ester carboxylesterase
MAQDLVAGIHAAEDHETTRRNAPEKVRVILIAHSAGGALSQYALSRSLATVHGFCMAAAIPAFGSASVYKFWSLSAPFHFPYRLFHPRYILTTTAHIHAAFFSPSTPVPVVRRLEKLLSPYESMLWPLQTLFRFVTGPDVLSSITPRAPGVTPRILVLAAEKDVLCRPEILLRAAQRYRAAFRELVRRGKIDGVSEAEISGKGDVEQGVYRDGVGYKVVKGLGHHLQNHEGWESGAEELLEWVERI